MDIEPPNLDIIEDQTFVVGSITDFNWLELIQNVYDNDDLYLFIEVVEDLVDYNTPGVYTVTVKVTDHSENSSS